MATMPKDAQDLFDNLVPRGARSSTRTRRASSTRSTASRSPATAAASGRSTRTANPPTCTKGDTGKAQCTVEVSHDDFKTMLSDPNAGMQLYFQGKLRVSGDPMLAMKLQQLFEIARPK